VLNPPHNRSRRLWAAAALVLALGLAVVLTLAIFARFPRTAAPGHAWLRIFEEGGILRIEWDRNQPAVRGASSGRLIIQDGNDRTEVELDPATLHNGAITYQRRSPNVAVQLVVPRAGGDFTTASRFLGQPVQPPPGARQPPDPAGASTPLPTGEPDSASRVTRPNPRREESVNNQVRPPAPLVARSTAQSPAPLPPEPLGSGSRPQQPAPVIPPASGRTQPLPAKPAMQPPAPEPYSGLQSGRAIWTGRLRRGQRLEIDGERANFGSLTGRLPPVPLRINAYPGEFRRDGVIVYGPTQRTEAPSAKNGWTRTQYRRSPERARQINVLETPSAANQWRKLALSSTRDLAMIVIYWEVINQSR